MLTVIFITPGKRIAFAIFFAGFTPLSHALTYDEALRLAEGRAAQIQARQNTIVAAHSARISAGELPDPKLFAGIDNLPASGPDAWNATRDFMTMQRIGLMQEFPSNDKREAARQLAQANISRAYVELQIARLVVKRDTALAWLQIYFLQQKRALLHELDAENLLLAASVTARLAANQGNTSDTLLPRQEAAILADQRDELERDLAKAQAALARWVGPAAREQLMGEPPVLTLGEDHLRHTLNRHPNLAIFNSEEDAARAQVAMAQATKKPDWGMALAYQRRGPAYGDMMSVQFSIDLPLFSKTRQDPQILAKNQELERVAAERETMFRQHTQELDSMLAERSALTRQINRMDNDWLPLGQLKVELALAGYRADREPLAAVLDARKFLIGTRMKRIDLEAQRAEVDASLRYLATEPQP